MTSPGDAAATSVSGSAPVEVLLIGGGNMGSALLGGMIGQHHGWRAAFFLAGAPGIAAGLLADVRGFVAVFAVAAVGASVALALLLTRVRDPRAAAVTPRVA